MIIRVVGRTEDLSAPEQQFGARPEDIFPSEVARIMRASEDIRIIHRLVGNGWAEIHLNDGVKAGGISILVSTTEDDQYEISVIGPEGTQFETRTPIR